MLLASSFLISALDGDEWLASRAGRFAPGELAPCTHWIGGWTGPRDGLDTMKKRKILRCWESNPDRPARGSSPYRLS
jgi:hypothetical protein